MFSYTSKKFWQTVKLVSEFGSLMGVWLSNNKIRFYTKNSLSIVNCFKIIKESHLTNFIFDYFLVLFMILIECVKSNHVCCLHYFVSSEFSPELKSCIFVSFILVPTISSFENCILILVIIRLWQTISFLNHHQCNYLKFSYHRIKWTRMISVQYCTRKIYVFFF